MQFILHITLPFFISTTQVRTLNDTIIKLPQIQIIVVENFQMTAIDHPKLVLNELLVSGGSKCSRFHTKPMQSFLRGASCTVHFALRTGHLHWALYTLHWAWALCTGRCIDCSRTSFDVRCSALLVRLRAHDDKSCSGTAGAKSLVIGG